ncbi:hypothetical protein GCK72_025895 [Caenorhabditis remanei]|uniref:Uncharacterized protein n=1 Tax=Caenorhabditis remanei TaxID=31234 RepID=A0A6A5G3C4_CAERE|nr:hypothetical protein GCK72_025895 [Caenorhabditis remanei]KAF1749427.1 hypothetical protein GCK72_025895 [Caenorhabditis remanei]
MNPKEIGQLGSQCSGCSSSIFPKNWTETFWLNLLDAYLASSQAPAEKPVVTISSASTSSLMPHTKDWMSHEIIQEFIKNYPVFEKIQEELNSSNPTASSPFDLTNAKDLSTSTIPRTEYQDSGALMTVEFLKALDAQFQMVRDFDIRTEFFRYTIISIEISVYWDFECKTI